MTDREAVSVRHATDADFDVVLQLVARLLDELGEEGEETGALATTSLRMVLAEGSTPHMSLLAETATGRAVGVATLGEAFALYAHGRYGIINEMYVEPDYRSQGIGEQFLAEIAAIGRRRGWRRIDVTAPESPRWGRTRSFYERNGYVFTGPKLKLLL